MDHVERQLLVIAVKERTVMQFCVILLVKYQFGEASAGRINYTVLWGLSHFALGE